MCSIKKTSINTTNINIPTAKNDVGIEKKATYLSEGRKNLIAGIFFTLGALTAGTAAFLAVKLLVLPAAVFGILSLALLALGIHYYRKKCDISPRIVPNTIKPELKAPNKSESLKTESASFAKQSSKDDLSLKAVFAFEGRVSVEKELSDAVVGDKRIASVNVEETDAADESPASNRKLSEKVNTIENGNQFPEADDPRTLETSPKEDADVDADADVVAVLREDPEEVKPPKANIDINPLEDSPKEDKQEMVLREDLEEVKSPEAKPEAEKNAASLEPNPPGDAGIHSKGSEGDLFEMGTDDLFIDDKQTPDQKPGIWGTYVGPYLTKENLSIGLGLLALAARGLANKDEPKAAGEEPQAAGEKPRRIEDVDNRDPAPLSPRDENKDAAEDEKLSFSEKKRRLEGKKIIVYDDLGFHAPVNAGYLPNK